MHPASDLMIAHIRISKLLIYVMTSRSGCFNDQKVHLVKNLNRITVSYIVEAHQRSLRGFSNLVFSSATFEVIKVYFVDLP